jgi:hypothetical protein
MKRVSLIFILSALCLNSVKAGIHFPFDIQIEKDTAVAPNKDQILSSLISLRDSIDNSVLAIQKKRERNKANYAQQFKNVYTQLTSQRVEIEKVIEEVVTTNEQTWDDNIRASAVREISIRRKDYYQTLETLKEVSNSK